MMKIDSVSSQPDRVGRYAVRFADGTTMRLYRQTVEDFGLFAGMELTDEKMKSLQDAAAAMSAKMRAVRIVSASNVSKKDLEHRLIQKGEDPAQAKAAVRWMSDLQLLDDRKTAEQIVQRCISRGYGAARAKQALYEKRIPKEYWDAALLDYPQQEDAIEAYLRDHLDANSDLRQKRKVVDALIRKGHSYGTISSCLRNLSFELDEFPEA